MEYCKNEPEFYEFMYVDSVYHFLKLFKQHFTAQKREDMSYLNVVNLKIIEALNSIAPCCGDCNTTSENRQEIMEMMK